MGVYWLNQKNISSRNTRITYRTYGRITFLWIATSHGTYLHHTYHSITLLWFSVFHGIPSHDLLAPISIFLSLISKESPTYYIPIRNTPDGMSPVRHGESTSTVLVIWSEWQQFGWRTNRNMTTSLQTWNLGGRGRQRALKRDTKRWVDWPRWYGPFRESYLDNFPTHMTRRHLRPSYTKILTPRLQRTLL